MARPQRALVVFETQLNNRMIHKREVNPKWINRRLSLYCDYTLPSLAAQTDRTCRICLGVRPETLDGIKRNKHLRSTLRRLGLLSRFSFSTLPRLMDLRRELAQSTPHDFYLFAHLDSDDMYHPLAAQEMLGMAPFRGATGNGSEEQEVIRYVNGFFMDETTKRMRVWGSMLCPFYAQVWSRRYLLRRGCKRLRFHTTTRRAGLIRVISDAPRFVVLCHDANHYTRYKHGEKELNAKQRAQAARAFPFLT